MTGEQPGLERTWVSKPCVSVLARVASPRASANAVASGTMTGVSESAGESRTPSSSPGSVRELPA